MGIDISMYAERFVRDHWELASPMLTDQEALPGEPEPLYSGRNYALFAILADVRNPSFSTTKYEPIALPRGLPADLSPELQRWVDWEIENQSNMYDCSWLSLRELLDFDWHGKSIVKEAKVDKDLAYLFEAHKPFPKADWPPDRPMTIWLYGPEDKGQLVNWTESYAESDDRYFVEKVIPQLSEYGLPEQVRIVFWFG